MVAIALVVAMGGLALIVDRLWLDAADLELTTAAESAALAAARGLVSDELLKKNVDHDERLQAARNSAAWVARQNLVAGYPVELDATAQGDIRFGRLVLDEHVREVRFEETDENPTTAVVTTHRSRATSNPVGLFVAGLTGLPFGDVVTRVEASVDNRILGLRPFEGTPVPVMPLAIWLRDPSGNRRDTWEQQIEFAQGADDYGYVAAENRVTQGGDGIPEIILRSQARGQQSSDSNLLVVDIGSGLLDKDVSRQFASGLSVDDLAEIDGELRVSEGGPEKFVASATLRHADRESLDALIGEPRICLLYSAAAPRPNTSLVQATCVRLVAIRVLALRDRSDGACEIVAQPCVLATRTALLNEVTPYHSGSFTTTSTDSTNRYIYRLQLTQ